MVQASEQDERAYLSQIIAKLRASLAEVENSILAQYDKLVETKRFAWQNMGNMDKVEQADYRIAATEESIFAELSIAERNKLRKLVLSPYFGRIDFTEDGVQSETPYYIGIHSYFDKNHELIIDWRAPLSSIFYDFETGPASYRAPEGEIRGDIMFKRQYRIRNSEMEYMLESAMNIGDDILQQELSKASDDKMKNIVATIQKEQNGIIRNDTAKVLIIQGAAGSGKTSIALHRVAFLLYRHKYNLKSDDVLVISPNKVFGSYIGNVLPELGEENIPQIVFEELARQFLGRGRKFQSFAEQVAELIELADDDKIARIRYKATNGFVGELKDFLRRCDERCFAPEGFKVEGFSVTAEELASEYERLRHIPIRRRIEKIAADRIAAYKRTHEQPLSTTAKRQIKERVLKQFPFKDAMAVYRQFYRETGRERLFHTMEKGRLEFCDVFPLAWLTLVFEGTAHRYGNIKHLLVDEMQDYTPIQYAFLAELFSCRMTILGDSHQSVNPYASSSLETIRPCFPGAECVELLKSYRSTIEIVNFAQTIRRNNKIIPIERHGEEPTLTGSTNESGEISHIASRIAAFRQSGYNSLGIICKSQPQANRLYKALKKEHDSIMLLDFSSEEFNGGVVITSCHMSKGLEFDWVIVPGCSDDIYSTELDRSLLYIACTRAMHLLELTFHGKQSSLIAPATLWYSNTSAE